MTDKRYNAKELRKMSLKALEEIGKPLGLKFTKNHTKSDRASKILSAYSQLDLAPEDVISPKEPANPERNDKFEQLCAEAVDSFPEDDRQENRGGVRAGAGRPPGLTNEMALYTSLPQQPHPAIKEPIKGLFNIWAARAHCPDIALTEDEAYDLALPWTQAAHLAGVLDRIPAWLIVTLSCVWTTANIVSLKAKLARKAAADRKAEQQPPAEAA